MQITITSNSVLATDATACVPWEDVWLRWRIGGKSYHFAPTLISRQDMDNEQKIALAIRRSKEHRDVAKREHWYEDDLEDFRKVRKAFRAGARVWMPRIENNIPHIYFFKDYITRRDAEEMIDALVTHAMRGHWRAEIPTRTFKWIEPKVLVGTISV